MEPTTLNIPDHCNLSTSLIDNNPRSPCHTLCLCRPQEEWDSEVSPVFTEEIAEWEAYQQGNAAHQRNPDQSFYYCMPTADPAFMVLLQQQGTNVRNIGGDYGRAGNYAAAYQRGWRDGEYGLRHAHATAVAYGE